MEKKQDQFMLTGVGLALGAGLGVLLWVLTGNFIYMPLGPSLGVVMGAIGDGVGQDQKMAPK